MGEHKYNETAKKAKEGLLPPKLKKMSKREERELVMRLIMEKTRSEGLFSWLGSQREY